MTEFWETKFKDERIMWGFNPSNSAIITKDFFQTNQIKDILIPGIGYGRNAKIFHENGIQVTGIEISQSAINLAKSENGLDIKIYHGSVTDMPFDDKLYEGIFCYALIHLLNKIERKRFINCCFEQLKPNGYMIFTIISKKASLFGEGRQLSNNRFEIKKGLRVFFYDSKSVIQEFKDYGLVDFREMDEPIKHLVNEPPMKCIYVKCRKAK